MLQATQRQDNMKLAIVPLFAALCGQVSAAHDTYYERAIKLMEANPLVDTHIDLPQIIRSLSKPDALMRSVDISLTSPQTANTSKAFRRSPAASPAMSTYRECGKDVSGVRSGPFGRHVMMLGPGHPV